MHTLPSPGLPIHTHICTYTHTLLQTTSTPLPFLLFPNRPASCQAKDSLFPPSLFISLCKSLSLPSPSFTPPSLHPKIPLRSATPAPSAPLCLNSFGPREQTKKGLCPGRKRWCVTQRGDNASAGSTQSQAPSLSLSVCLSLINYLQFTFAKAHTAQQGISLQSSVVGAQHMQSGVLVSQRKK